MIACDALIFLGFSLLSSRGMEAADDRRLLYVQ